MTSTDANTPTGDSVPGDETAAAPGVNRRDRNTELVRQIRADEEKLAEAERTGNTLEARRARRRIRTATDELFSSNLGLADGWAKRFRKDSDRQAAEDYRDAARLGLTEAILTWDPEKGSLSNWAWSPIKKSLFSEVARTEHRMTRHAFSNRQAVITAMEELKEAGEDVNVATVAARTGLADALVWNIMSARNAGPDKRLDAPVGDSGGATLADIIVVPDSPVDEMELSDERLGELTKDLSINQLWVVLRYHGLDSAYRENHTQIGATLGRSREASRKTLDTATRLMVAAAQPGS